MRKTVAFLGVGNMGSAILGGMLDAGVYTPENVVLCDVTEEKCRPFTQRGCIFISSPAQAVQAADTVLLAVKPQQLGDLLKEIAPFCEGRLILSIAAGVTIARIRQALPGASVIRIMPNTPLLVGCGVSALCRDDCVSDEDYALANRIFSASGTVVSVREEQINPITALTSSSIAYFARFIGDMCAWAKENGFDDDEETLRMVCESAIGASRLLTDTSFDPRSLERAVTSPGGTTERAMAVFTERELARTVADAMDACRKRADELSGC